MPFSVQLLLSVLYLQLQIKGPLTPFPISVLSNKGPTGLLIASCYAGPCYQQWFFSLMYKGFVYIFAIFSECSRGQISQVTMT